MEGVVRVMDVPMPNNNDNPPYQLFNIGNNNPVQLTEFIDILVDALGNKNEVKRELKPMQPGDVKCTYADIDKLNSCVGYKPSTPLRDGLREFAKWFKEYRHSS